MEIKTIISNFQETSGEQKEKVGTKLAEVKKEIAEKIEVIETKIEEKKEVIGSKIEETKEAIGSKIEERKEEKNAEKKDEPEISRRAQIVRDLVADFNKVELVKNMRSEERGQSDMDKKYRYPDHLKAERINFEYLSMEMLSVKDKPSDIVILQLHGGGYVGAMKNRYRTLAGLYSEVSKGANVLTIDYRVAPQHVFPAALQDGMLAYRYLKEKGYTEDKIILAGDSAGGGLALCMCHYMKDNGIKLPRAVITMSPWTDLTASGSSYEDNYEIDPIFGKTRDSLIYDSAYIGDADPTNPYISPMFGDFSDFPPMLIQVGTYEMLLSDSVTVYEKAKEVGVKVKLSKYEGMFHVFQVAAKLMPESMKAWAEVGSFLEAVGVVKDE